MVTARENVGTALMVIAATSSSALADILPALFFGLSLEDLLVAKRVCIQWRCVGRQYLTSPGWQAVHIDFANLRVLTRSMQFVQLLPFSQRQDAAEPIHAERDHSAIDRWLGQALHARLEAMPGDARARNGTALPLQVAVQRCLPRQLIDRLVSLHPPAVGWELADLICLGALAEQACVAKLTNSPELIAVVDAQAQVFLPHHNQVKEPFSTRHVVNGGYVPTCLHLAIEYGGTDLVITTLLQVRPEAAAVFASRCATTVLHLAAERLTGSDVMADATYLAILAAQPHNAHVRSNGGEDAECANAYVSHYRRSSNFPLLLAACAGASSDVLCALLAQNPQAAEDSYWEDLEDFERDYHVYHFIDPDTYCSPSGALPLHFAAHHDRYEAVEALLLAHPAAAEVHDESWRNALLHAAVGGASRRTMRALCVAHPPSAVQRDISGDSAVDHLARTMSPKAAAWEGHLDCQWVMEGWPDRVPGADEDDHRLADLLYCILTVALERLSLRAEAARGQHGSEVGESPDTHGHADGHGMASDADSMPFECLVDALKRPQSANALALLLLDGAVGGHGCHRYAGLLVNCSKHGSGSTPDGNHTIVSSAYQMQTVADRMADDLRVQCLEGLLQDIACIEHFANCMVKAAIVLAPVADPV